LSCQVRLICDVPTGTTVSAVGAIGTVVLPVTVMLLKVELHRAAVFFEQEVTPKRTLVPMVMAAVPTGTHVTLSTDFSAVKLLPARVRRSQYVAAPADVVTTLVPLRAVRRTNPMPLDA